MSYQSRKHIILKIVDEKEKLMLENWRNCLILRRLLLGGI